VKVKETVSDKACQVQWGVLVYA